MTQLAFCLDELLRHLREHRGVVALATATMALAFFLLSLFLVVLVNVQGVTDDVTDEVRVRVFLDNSVGDDGRKALQRELEHNPAVEAVEFISKDEALTRLRAQLKDQAVLLEGLGGNPLPASLDLRLRNDPAVLADLPVLASQIGKLKGVEQVRYGQEWIGRFRVLLTFLHTLGFGLSVVVVVAVIAIIANTIRFMIDARREDIEVLNIVGASHAVITIPYVLEGMLLGVAGAALALGLLAALLAGFGANLEILGGFLFGRGGLRFIPPAMVLLLILGGALLGGIGSFISLQRSFRHVPT